MEGKPGVRAKPRKEKPFHHKKTVAITAAYNGRTYQKIQGKC
jgi:hypothetical protein